MEAWSFLSAFILSFWVSRAVARINLPLRGNALIFAVHALAGSALFIAVGLIKAYFTTFAAHEARIVLLTQAIWLVLDLSLTGYRRLKGVSDA